MDSLNIELRQKPDQLQGVKINPTLPEENERRFLLNPFDPEVAELLKDAQVVDIAQWYLHSDDPSVEDRVRQSVCDGVVTYERQKKVGHGVTRGETPAEMLTKEEAHALIATYALACPQVKQRYLIEHQDQTFAINCFGGSLSGLWTAEVEFSSAQEAHEFVAPSFFGKEVTEDLSFEGATLISQGIPSSYRAQAINNIFGNKPRYSVGEAVDKICDALLSLSQTQPDTPVFLFVGAPSAAGKGFITDRIKEKLESILGGSSVSILSTDRYFAGVIANNALTNQRRAQAEALGIDPTTIKAVTFDDPEGLDFTTLEGDIRSIQNLSPGDVTEVQRYSFSTGEPDGRESFSVGRIVLVEGLYPLSDALLDLPGMRVFISADENTRLIRRISRDALERDFINPGDQFDFHNFAVGPAVDRSIIPTAINADIIVESNLDPLVERIHVPSARSQKQLKVWATLKDALLTKHQGTLKAHFTLQDRYLIHPEEVAKAEPNMWRLRQIGEDKKRGVVTFKWPSLEDKADRPVLSFPVNQTGIEAMNKIFGAGEEILITKTRSVWQLPLPDQGGYVELNVDTDITRIERDGSVAKLSDVTEFSWSGNLTEEMVREFIQQLFPGVEPSSEQTVCVDLSTFGRK